VFYDLPDTGQEGDGGIVGNSSPRGRMSTVRNGPERKRPPYLPDGYALDETADPGAVILRRPDGSEVVAYFGERASVEEVERAAWEDRRGHDDG
jgi:hypothetical protein